MNTETIKNDVIKSYGQIATNNVQSGCCSTESSCCSSDISGASMALSYDQIDGHVSEADLSLGCGLPTEIAEIKEGDTVIDLGSGAGNDAFVARSIVGETGRVIGVDMTPEMVIKALQNTQKLGFKNVEFVLGEIEDLNDIDSNQADVVISNCVLNLVPNKEKAFAEINRVLKLGGHFSISDIVHVGELPEGIRKSAEMYAGCIAGALEKGDYLGLIKAAGFKNIQLRAERLIELPDDILRNHLEPEQLRDFRDSGAGIYSITVYAEKLEEGNCCETTAEGCCGSESSSKIEDKASCCGTNSNSGSSGCC